MPIEKVGREQLEQPEHTRARARPASTLMMIVLHG